MKYYRKYTIEGSRWDEITERQFTAMLHGRFSEIPFTDWRGDRNPSRYEVLDYMKAGGILTTYAAYYKIVLFPPSNP